MEVIEKPEQGEQVITPGDLLANGGGQDQAGDIGAHAPIEHIDPSTMPGAITTKHALASLSVSFFDEMKCRSWLLQNLHPIGAYSPKCNVEIKDRSTLFNFWCGKRCRCKACGKWFSAFSKTVFQECQLDERSIFILAILTELNLHKDEIARVLAINPATVRIWQGKFKAIELTQEIM